ncbi:MAG: Spy/CpxP family protein refolding chaperone [Chthoniobacterales bacterium]
MKKLVLTLCGIAIALVGAIGLAGAVENNDNNADGGRPHGFRHGHGMFRALREVGVNDSQKEQIRNILRESRPTAQPLVKQLVQERKGLRDLVQSSPVNEPAIRAQAARVAQIQADLAVQRAHVADRVNALLTPDQVAKLKELRAERDTRRQEWMNRRFNRDGA